MKSARIIDLNYGFNESID